MLAKDLVLCTLWDRADHVLTQTLAVELDLRSHEVNQALAGLRNDGWSIDVSTRGGVRLIDDGSVFSGPLVETILASQGHALTVIHHREISSTNTWALDHIDELPPLALVCADAQTAGRGRFSRSFHSPPRTGLYTSLVIKQDLAASQAGLLTCATAVGVRRALAGWGIDSRIKWVNDLFVDGKKCGGILTEGKLDVESGNLVHAVIGIGLNITTKDFPADIQDRAGALAAYHSKALDTSLLPSRNALAAAIVHEVLGLVSALPANDFMAEYREASMLIGKEVTVARPGETLTGRVLDVADDGALLIIDSSGSPQRILSGEASIGSGTL